MNSFSSFVFRFHCTLKEMRTFHFHTDNFLISFERQRLPSSTLFMCKKCFDANDSYSPFARLIFRYCIYLYIFSSLSSTYVCEDVFLLETRKHFSFTIKLSQEDERKYLEFSMWDKQMTTYSAETDKCNLFRNAIHFFLSSS